MTYVRECLVDSNECTPISELYFSSDACQSKPNLLRTIMKIIINHALYQHMMSSGKQALLSREERYYS